MDTLAKDASIIVEVSQGAGVIMTRLGGSTVAHDIQVQWITTNLAMFQTVIWNGNGVMGSEHRAAWYLREGDEVGTSGTSGPLHLLSHQAVHSRESAVFRAMVTALLAVQPQQ